MVSWTSFPLLNTQTHIRSIVLPNVCLVKPFLIRGPQNQTAVTGSSVIFQCRVGGEPLPDVLWRRTASGGNMPLGELSSHAHTHTQHAKCRSN